jgi:hypothetical protein
MEDTRTPQVDDSGGPVVASHLDEYGGDSRPPVYWDPVVGKQVYRAYSLGNCVRALTAFRKGVTPADHPEWLLKAFREGHENESVILSMLYEQGDWEPVDGGAQREIEIPVGTGALIRGHNDDVAIAQKFSWTDAEKEPDRDQRVIEAKAFAQSTYKKWVSQGFDAFPYYATQLSFYMAALGLPALFVVGLKDEETRVVTEVKVFPVDEPPVPLAKIKARVARIEHLAELPGCDFNQYPCQMYFLGDENGCGSGGNRGVDGSRLPKPTSQKRLEEIDLESQLRDSVALERLNGPAEEFFEGMRARNRGAHMMQSGEEQIATWESDNPKLAGEPGGVRRYQTSKWHIAVHPVGGIAVRPKRSLGEEGP